MWVPGMDATHAGDKTAGGRSLAVLPFLVLICVTRICSSLVCPGYEHNLDGKRCCRKCHPGAGMDLPCTAANNTACKPCIYGRSFSSLHSHSDVCRNCTVCQRGAYPRRPCNVTHDTLCECKRDHFFYPLEQRCKRCSFCPIGWGAKVLCNKNRNTRCRPCPNGTFSDRRSGQGCHVCTVCGPHQVMLQKCNPRQNTVCVDVPRARSSPPSYLFTHSANQGHNGARESDVIPLYCALLGAVIVGLLVYVIIKHWKKPVSGHHGKLKGLSTPMLADSNKKQGSDSGVYLEPELKPVFNSTKVQDLPSLKRKALESYLDTDREDYGGWASLARELGYNKSRITGFEIRAEQDAQTPIRYLLTDWGRTDSATVSVLVHALRKIGREDVVKILYGETKCFHLPNSSSDDMQLV